MMDSKDPTRVPVTSLRLVKILWAEGGGNRVRVCWLRLGAQVAGDMESLICWVAY